MSFKWAEAHGGSHGYDTGKWEDSVKQRGESYGSRASLSGEGGEDLGQADRLLGMSSTK